jgi:hypothetical protein
MKKTIKDLIEAGHSVKDMLDAIKELRPDDIIRCDSCNRRIADIDAGEIVIKCRCGDFNKIQ